MGQATVRSGFDSYVRADKPSANAGTGTLLRLTSAAYESYIYFKVPAPRGATVTSATLRLYARGASSGSRTLTVRLNQVGWKVSQITWSNRPGPGTVLTTATIGTLTDGQPVDIDVTALVQAIVNGASNFGFKITTTSTTQHTFNSLDAGDLKPYLTVIWSDKPSKPTSLSPAGGTIGVPKPTVRFDYTDVSGSTELAAVQVQVDPAQSATPSFDSGRVATTQPQLDLSGTFPRTQAITTTSASTTITSVGGFLVGSDVGSTITGTGIPAGATITAVASANSATISAAATATGSPTATITESYAGLAANATTYWRVRVQDAAGLWSDWSDWGSMKYVAKGSVTITNPASGTSPFVTEQTPPILWTYSGTQVAWQVRITTADRQKILHDSHKTGGTATSYTIPKGVLKNLTTYVVEVRCWDAVTDRQASPGDAIYAGATRSFTVNDDATTAVAVGLTAVQRGLTPFVDLTWTRSTAPDSWTVLRDGKAIEADLLPADTLTSGTTHKWTDYGASPNSQHSYNVKAVVNGKQSTSGTTAKVTTHPEGIWLVDSDLDLIVPLWGDDAGTWEMGDDSATYTTVGGTETVRVVTGMRGLEGSLSGQIMDGFGYTYAGILADLLTIKERPSRTVQLAVADISIEAIIGNISIAPNPLTRNGQLVRDVTFDFWQVGDLGFDPQL